MPPSVILANGPAPGTAEHRVPPGPGGGTSAWSHRAEATVSCWLLEHGEMTFTAVHARDSVSSLSLPSTPGYHGPAGIPMPSTVPPPLGSALPWRSPGKIGPSSREPKRCPWRRAKRRRQRASAVDTVQNTTPPKNRQILEGHGPSREWECSVLGAQGLA